MACVCYSARQRRVPFPPPDHIYLRGMCRIIRLPGGTKRTGLGSRSPPQKTNRETTLPCFHPSHIRAPTATGRPSCYRRFPTRGSPSTCDVAGSVLINRKTALAHPHTPRGLLLRTPHRCAGAARAPGSCVRPRVQQCSAHTATRPPPRSPLGCVPLDPQGLVQRAISIYSAPLAGC